MKEEDDDDVIEDLENNPILYMRNQPTEEFYLILHGRVDVCSGNEGFHVEMGAFATLGTEALQNDNYKPDFSAKVLCKCFLI